MTDVLCDCNCRYSAPNGVCTLKFINIDNYGECADFEEIEEEVTKQLTE